MLNTRQPIIHTLCTFISATLLVLASTANAHIAYQGDGPQGAATQGAATALTTDTNNRQLDQSEQIRIAKLAKDQAHKASPNATPEQRTADEQYWQGLLTSEALALTDDRDHKDRMNYVDDIIGTLRPGTEGYYYAPNYINDTYTVRALLYQHSGTPILGSDGRPLISNGAPLTLFSATPEQRHNHNLFAAGPAGNSVSLPFVWENRHNPNAAADYDASQSANRYSVLPQQETLDRQRLERYRTLNGSIADSPVGPEDLVPGLGMAAKGVLRTGRVVGEGMWGVVGRSSGVVANSGLRSSTVVSPERAKQFLLKNDFPADRADDFLSSIDGPITARLVRPGEDFGRYSGRAEGPGSFLTKSTFDTPEQAVDALFLRPYGNPATFRQPVVPTNRSIVLEGLIKNGAPPGTKQTIVVDRNAFEFGQGVPLK